MHLKATTVKHTHTKKTLNFSKWFVLSLATSFSLSLSNIFEKFLKGPNFRCFKKASLNKKILFVYVSHIHTLARPYSFSDTHRNTHTHTVGVLFGLSEALASLPDPELHPSYYCCSQMGQTTGCVLVLISHNRHQPCVFECVCLSNRSQKLSNHTDTYTKTHTKG